MFEKKQQAKGQSSQSSGNNSSTSVFVQAGAKISAQTRSGNGALKYSTTGDAFVDQMGLMGSYKAPRKFSDISVDAATLWAIDPRLALCFTFFLRIITRVVSFFDGTKTSVPQRGSGLRHEGIMRMIWLHINHPDSFWKNISLWVSISSWKDIITMLQYDLVYNGWNGRVLDWEKFGKLLLAGLENPKTCELVKKYLPQLRANSACNTIEAQSDNQIAKWICSLLFGSKEGGSTYKRYRKMKSSGTAHEWQKLISQGKHSLVDFDSVHGRALALMVSGKYIANQGLEKKYEEWISAKPVAKFTGYVNELFAKLPTKKYQMDTLNAQFMGLVETAKQGAVKSTSMIVVRDTSGSMMSPATGTNQSAFDIAKALALFFSYMLPEGRFANSWIEFNHDAKMHSWRGTTPIEKWNADKTHYIGNTNFQSVIDLFCRIKNDAIPESEFPSGIICISDGEFDASELKKTNVQTALNKLRKGGFSEEYVNNFKIVLWNLRSHAYGNTAGNKFETYGNVDNVFYFSGYDGSIVAFLTGTTASEKPEPKNAKELFLAAMDQEVMKLIEV